MIKKEMITDPKIAAKVLPAWFLERMIGDDWYFALVVSSGHTVFISCITAISSDGEWIDVQLLDHVPSQAGKLFRPKNAILCTAGERSTASIRVNSVMVAYEVAST